MTPDAYAADLIRSLGFSRPARVEAYIRAVLRVVPTSTGLVRLEDGDAPTMYVNASLPAHRRRWLMAQSFAGHVMKIDGWEPGAVRAQRSAVAAALLMPADVVLRELQKAPHADVAAQLQLPLGSVWMREAELREKPTAVAMPGIAWARVAGDPRGRLDPAECLQVATRGLPVVGLRRVVTPDGETVLRSG